MSYYNNKEGSKTSYQQQKRYCVNQENNLMCPRKRFCDDLLAQLKTWREEGNEIILCLDANNNIYKGEVGRGLVSDKLNMKEAVGMFMGREVGATFF